MQRKISAHVNGGLSDSFRRGHIQGAQTPISICEISKVLFVVDESIFMNILTEYQQWIEEHTHLYEHQHCFKNKTDNDLEHLKHQSIIS